ncbi:MAG TPA: autotransporter-associated beta strand repeat-containing protein [Terrimicrobiaceae bacterium]|nr:autotransporter-associated beta strand repeat-containing protein [Terrimicrobiaceae bacterium]
MNKRLPFRIALTFLIGLPLVGHAASLNWDGSTGNGLWSDANNWTAAQVPVVGDIVTLGDSSTNAPQAITLSSQGTLTQLTLNASGNRTYSLTGSTLEFRRTAASAAKISWTASAGRKDVTINSDILVSGTDETQAVALLIDGGNADAPTLTINGNLAGSTGGGYGARTLNYSSLNRLVINGANSLTGLEWSKGEIVAGSSTALGLGTVIVNTASTTLSLRSDVNVLSSGPNSWSTSVTTNLRISEESQSSANRTLTLNARATGAGSLQWIDNVNSTGNLILDSKYAGTHNIGSLVTNATAIVRFSQSGNAGFSGVMSGAGQLEQRGAGTTTLSGSNTYTGKTIIASGTLTLGAAGSFANSSEINLGTSGTQGTLNVTAKSSFAFGSGQKVSGFGTINIGTGKTVTISGELSPGNSPGKVSITGNLALDNTTATTMELSGTGGVKGTDFDNVTVTEALTYDGTLSIVNFGGFNLYQVGTYSLFDFASQTGNFDSVTFGGNALSYSAGVWSGNSGGFEYSLTLSSGDLAVSAIPEPGAVALASLGAAFLLSFRRRLRPGKSL